MNLDYCNKKCPIGSKARSECLAENESVGDAVIDFWHFVDKCIKTCPYKDKHTEEDK
jgi:hypothetical protein